jgi:hypothetical protein
MKVQHSLNSSEFPKTFDYFNQSLADGLSKDITGIGLTAAWLTMASRLLSVA